MSALNLGVLVVSFQFNLVIAVETEPFQRRIDRIEQARRLEIVDSGQVAPALQAEMRQEGPGWWRR